jgi:uncharacterized integral membrane protein (TIGR00697 family)
MPKRTYKYYDLVMAGFVTVLICSNVIGAAKVATVWGFAFGSGVLFFPISYIFNDILTEVYGYARARKVVWAGFGGLIFAAFMSWVVVSLPPSPDWGGQAAYQSVFGSTWRIVLASLTAFFLGEFANSFVLAKMKVITNGRFLWSAPSARRSWAKPWIPRCSIRWRSWGTRIGRRTSSSPS